MFSLFFSVFILCIFVAAFVKIGTVPIATPLIEIKFACNRYFTSISTGNVCCSSFFLTREGGAAVGTLALL